jgi:hypothetical protein
MWKNVYFWLWIHQKWMTSLHREMKKGPLCKIAMVRILQTPLIISYAINVKSCPLDNMDVTMFICEYILSMTQELDLQDEEDINSETCNIKALRDTLRRQHQANEQLQYELDEERSAFWMQQRNLLL